MTMPTLFVSHGSPMTAIQETPAHQFMKRLAGLLPRPKAIVVVSAHFTTHQPAVVADPHPSMIYDFGGFPEALSRIVYPAPGDPDLARRVADLVTEAGLPVRIVPERGYDHGSWVPLSLIYPDATIPVVQLSIQPDRDTTHHYALGAALAALRHDDILVLATGAMTHNLMEVMRGGLRDIARPPEHWAVAFTDWIEAKAKAGAVDDLLRTMELAPDGVRAHPDDDHFLPFFVALGAAGPNAKGTRIHASIEYGSLAMDTYRFD
ncbi:MAG: dioxygenase [Bauldia sp.]|nr:dioxygenase [Bauldia sp.]